MCIRPNIILISTDQQRYDSVGANGSACMDTPNLDRLAYEGVTFRRAYCPNTVCTPSRVSMMTGLHLSRHGSYNIGTILSDPSLFLSSLLRKTGCRTRHVGKAHWYPWESPSPETLGPEASREPFADFAGFETLVDSRFNGTFEIAGNGKYAWGPYFDRGDVSKWTRAYYYSMVQLIDRQAGRILDALDALGLTRNTFVIFMSDHGEMLGDHGIGQKGPLVYEGVNENPAVHEVS